MKRLLLLIALFLTTAASAQFADVATSLEILSKPEPARPGDIVTWRATVRNLGPEPATRVTFTSSLTFSHICTNQVFAVLAPGESRTIDCSAPIPAQTFAFVDVLAYSSDIHDPDQSNNSSRIDFELVTTPDLYIETFPPRVVDAGLPFELHVFYANQANTTATGVEIQIGAQGIGSVVKMPPNCTSLPFYISCAIGEVPNLPSPNHFGQLDFVLMAPDSSAQHISIGATIYGAEDDLKPDSNFVQRETTTFRTFFVTSTADDGSGSLRQAMNDANAACHNQTPPCKIAFRIPNGGSKWLTLRPESPLPLMTTVVQIDGAMQAKYIADSNPDGPEIEISGERVREGSGIQSLRGCLIVRGLTINGFPSSGIHLGGGCSELQAVDGNYIGTDPTGMRAIPNLLGVTSTGGWGGDPSPITNNIISGNLRSGVSIQSGEYRIANNIIGLNRAATAALGNGASGVYLGPESYGTDVIDNYIGFNHHYGISLARDAGYRAIRGNSFQANSNLAIDYGLDGPTAEVPDFSATGRPVKSPIITAARYDAVLNKTIIEGMSDTHPDRHQVWFDVYANDEPDNSGYGEGQYFLGSIMANAEGRFTLTLDGRAPGPWIAATTTRVNIIGLAKAPQPTAIHGSGIVSTTSEFSRTVRIE